VESGKKKIKDKDSGQEEQWKVVSGKWKEKD